MKPGERVIGVDEVGRGPLAGPVVAAAAWLSEAAAEALATAGLRDSKKLSAKRREVLADLLDELCADGRADMALGAASAREIDALNIRNATFLAMRRAVSRLRGPIGMALVDGNAAPPGIGPARTLIKGDSRSLSIAAAAVLAKTVRDRAMTQLDERWPGYGWATNAGYPTAAHRAALAKRGPSPHHRRSFGGV
ncbi:MAG: ribonuclease HII [Neomegalonema sp.]|nr:ribonuclease HII [Neomegalonema sp.]